MIISWKGLVDQGLQEFPCGSNYIVIIGRNDPVQLKKKKESETFYLESEIELKQITVRKEN